MSISSIGSSGYSYSISTRNSSTQSTDRSEMTQKLAEELMSKADTDGDGSLSLSELDDNSDLMTAGDTDGDGQLSESELVSLMNKMAPQGPPPGMTGADGSSDSSDGTQPSEDEMVAKMASDMISSKDSDGDGSLSASELGVDSDTFSKLDTNGDGVVSSDELSTGLKDHEIAPGPPPGPPPGQQASSSDSSDSSSSDSSSSSASSSQDLGEMLMAFMAKKGLASYQQSMNAGLSSFMSDTTSSGVSLTA